VSLKSLVAPVVLRPPVASVAEKFLTRYYERRLTDPNHNRREWFDHQAHFYLPDQGGAEWAERGSVSNEIIQPGDRVLDLCCGDGFFARRFYVERAEHIDAVDLDPEAIRHATTVNGHPAISFGVANVTSDPFPAPVYGSILWTAAIEHFGDDAIVAILEKCRAALAPDGALGGMTLAADRSGNVFHERVFADADDLKQLLARVFPTVFVATRVHPHRTCLYFRCYLSEERAREDIERLSFS
jgi:cyclopropane fatty-acyl-phospholipid synthase-like methyltransferase